MIIKTSWSTEDLKMLTQVDNHKIMYDGYEYYWGGLSAFRLARSIS